MHTVSAIDLDLSLVVFPGDSELDDSLGNGGDFESGLVFWVLLEEGGVLERRGKLWGQAQSANLTTVRHPRSRKTHLCTPARILARMEGWT